MLLYTPLCCSVTQYYYPSVIHSVCNYQKVYADISAALIITQRHGEGGFLGGAII